MQRERELLRAVGLYVTRYSFPGPDTLRGIRTLVEEERAALPQRQGGTNLEAEHDKLESLKAREGILMLLAANAATGLHGYMPIQDEYHPRWTSDCWEAWGWSISAARRPMDLAYFAMEHGEVMKRIPVG
ncbi:hypothetical protein AG1IA_08448 [Rhizoctonia solani AG-1 IA]|uniref:Uncharacterized protein n=1 Tax=Thanatephorus cucumeris (strain AG1-IA) TaxID=983506 RepID=L8WME1_THACA|nr:hypothetical protein AG1IA_08448 [Rhizoctonia solani AG-1 IA]